MKRSSEHQITKDDVPSGEDSDDGLREGFDKATADVMAKRRIVKARRRPVAATAAPSDAAPKANPFAAAFSTPAGTPTVTVKPSPTVEPAEPLVASRSPAGTAPVTAALSAPISTDDSPARTAEATVVDTTPVVKAKPAHVDSLAKDNSVGGEASAEANPVEPETPAGADAEPAETEPNATASSADKPSLGTAEFKPLAVDARKQDDPAANVAAEPAKSPADVPYLPKSAMDAPDPETTAVSPVRTAAVSAAETHAEDGAKKPAFSFGGISAGGNLAVTSFGDAAATATGFSFATSTPSLPSTSPAAPAPVVTKNSELATEETAAAAKFAETEVVTGEEDEKESFRSKCKLFLLEDGRWVERGVGPLKLNTNPLSSKSRLVMRTDATLRVILNTPVFEAFTMDRATDRSARFQGLSVDDAQKHVTYLGRFSSKSDLDRLIRAVESVKK
jgi:RanBP1 domain/NUP50 (Nucleoporin 50 kDa)